MHPNRKSNKLIITRTDLYIFMNINFRHINNRYLSEYHGIILYLLNNCKVYIENSINNKY